MQIFDKELGTDAPEYAQFLNEALTCAAQSNCLDKARILVQHCEWPNNETREACLLDAAGIACKRGYKRLLNLLIDGHGHVSEAIRMTWPLHRHTWQTALKGISTDTLLTAQVDAAERDTGANYELVSHGLLASNPTEAQRKTSNEADLRHAQFHLGKTEVSD